MEIGLGFSLGIYSLVAVLICFIIKIWFGTLVLNKTAHRRYMGLQRKIQKENMKYQIYEGHVLLADELNKSLFTRLFQITKDLILMQKIIFE